MTRLTGGSQSLGSFDQWLIGTVSGQTATAFSVTAIPLQIDYTGTGITYDANGNAISGTITQIDIIQGNVLALSLADIRISVPAYRTFVANGNVQDFLTSVLSGNDTISHPGDLGSPDLYDGFAGN